MGAFVVCEGCGGGSRQEKLGGGLPELRTESRCRGHAEVVWREVMKSKKVPDAVRAAVAADPDLLRCGAATAPSSAPWTPWRARRCRTCR